jgi:hypothetical protein
MRFPRPSEAVRTYAALLEEELRRWPEVTIRPMFGFRAAYRGNTIFAMLPDKRAMERPEAMAYKLPSGTASREGQKWHLLDIEDEGAMSKALHFLRRAYRNSLV